MEYFPFFMDIENKNALIVGGGRAALHKIKKLLPYKPKMTVVSPEISDELKTLTQKNDMCVILREFEPGDIFDKMFVIASSDNEEINAYISDICNKKNIPVNVVDDRDKCSFIFPSLVHDGRLSIGISTGGASPEASTIIKSELTSIIPSDIDEILDYLNTLRTAAKEYINDKKLRAHFLKMMSGACMDRNGIFDDDKTGELLKKYSEMSDIADISAKAVLVEAGCGSYELITLKGLRTIKKARVIIYDDMIDKKLLECASESCELIYVGKRNGRQSMKQDEINELWVKKAKEGGLVVRLKGGAPIVFGRVGEEMEALRAAGIDIEYIPGAALHEEPDFS